MTFHDIEQRTAAWYDARLGMPTASQFDRLVGERTLKDGIRRYLKDSSKTYEAELLAEKFFGFDEEKQQRAEAQYAVRYGIEREDEARRKLNEDHLFGKEILPGGFFDFDAGGLVGCSPDGRVISGNSQELVEIKCPQPAQQIKTILYGIEDYKAQIQGQLLISGYQCCHFYSYRHDCPPHYERVEPDLAYQRDLERILAEFRERLEANYRYLAGMKGWPT